METFVDVMGKYFLAMAVMLGALLMWHLVQKLSRYVAAQHPEFGPAREEGGGCGGSGKCNCSKSKQASCSTKK